MRLVLLILLALLVGAPVFAQQTTAPCGVVDAIDLPIDNLVKGYDDFGLYRPRFGGNHTGIDIGFDRWGDPVHAVARGRVTYSDIAGWDTEKGVVIVEHTFPDGSIAYSLYGHMEQTDTILFAGVGRCVERGDVVGAIGWPSLGRPHLHFEMRDFLPNDGGPGYVTGNPLEEGWYNPLDFVALWRARLTPAFISYATFDVVPSVPPVRLDNGQYVIASSNVIAGIALPRQTLWRVEADGVVTGLAALPNHQVAAHTRSGQVMVLDNGRYAAIWTVSGPDRPFLVVSGLLIFVTSGGGLAAYDTAGNQLWVLPEIGSERVTHLELNGMLIVYGVRTDSGTVVRTIRPENGEVRSEYEFASPPLIARTDSAWFVLDGSKFTQLAANAPLLTNITVSPGRSAAMIADVTWNSYLYLNDAENSLLSLASDGSTRWRVPYPTPPSYLPPLMAVGRGCLLYTLDVDGMLNVFSTADGKLLNQLQLYAGGSERTMPDARLLKVDYFNEQVEVAAGFLTTMVLDGNKLGGEQAACLLG